MTRYCLVLQKCLKLKYFIYSKYKLKHFLNIFSCGRSSTSPNVRLSVCHQVEIQPSTTSRMFKNVCKMFQNVPECMQNVPECSRMYEKYPECSSMFQTVCRVCQNVPKCMQNACRSMSLPAVTYACLQVHELACSFFLCLSSSQEFRSASFCRISGKNC